MPSNPLALIAELTHRCPLHCVYCSNPLQMVGARSELSTGHWLEVFAQAAKLGVLHLHLTGGEPLARADLEDLIAGARQAGLYTNLITSGIGLQEDRLTKLIAAGLDHIQLSFQDSREPEGNWISGARAHAYKVALASAIRRHRVAFTVNLVVHRQNLDHLEEMISFIEQLQPGRMEIAHAQYYGWALKNRAALLPTRAQLDRAIAIVQQAEQRLAGRIRIDSVIPDYYARFPKACMGGWGQRLILVNPAGKALPCHAAEVIPGLSFENVRERSLAWIWNESDSFRKFRGEDWMQEPCRSCERRTEDFGGCRCQAFLLTGDSRATDPACSLSPQRQVIDSVLVQINAEGPGPDAVQPERRKTDLWTYRPNPN